MRREGKEERKKKKKKERIDANVLQNWVSFKKVVDGWFGKYNVGLEFYIVNLLVHIDNSTRAIVQILFWATSKQGGIPRHNGSSGFLSQSKNILTYKYIHTLRLNSFQMLKTNTWRQRVTTTRYKAHMTL
jgi:hypothetical protein